RSTNAFIKHLVTFVDDLDVLCLADSAVSVRRCAVACDTGKRNAVKVEDSSRHVRFEETLQGNRLVLKSSVGLVKMVVGYLWILIFFAFPRFDWHGLDIAQLR